jgi:hypothetical protein
MLEAVGLVIAAQESVIGAKASLGEARGAFRRVYLKA